MIILTFTVPDLSPTRRVREGRHNPSSLSASGSGPRLVRPRFAYQAMGIATDQSLQVHVGFPDRLQRHPMWAGKTRSEQINRRQGDKRAAVSCNLRAGCYNRA